MVAVANLWIYHATKDSTSLPLHNVTGLPGGPTSQMQTTVRGSTIDDEPPPPYTATAPLVDTSSPSSVQVAPPIVQHSRTSNTDASPPFTVNITITTPPTNEVESISPLDRAVQSPTQMPTTPVIIATPTSPRVESSTHQPIESSPAGSSTALVRTDSAQPGNKDPTPPNTP
jgi:hypothetical protein